MEPKHILTIGAHPGDMEISCGAVLAAHRAKGNKVTIVHLTDGVEYDPRFSMNHYSRQKRIEAEEAALVINADVILGPFDAYNLQNNKETRSFVSNLIRKTNPTSIITHWKNSIQQDHKITHKIVCDALTLSESANMALNYPTYNGTKGLYFAESWEDKEDFEPYIYIDTTKFMDIWLKMVSCFEHFKNGNTINFSYIKYYQALAKVRGTESHFSYACAFNLIHSRNKQCLDFLQ